MTDNIKIVILELIILAILPILVAVLAFDGPRKDPVDQQRIFFECMKSNEQALVRDCQSLAYNLAKDI